MLWDMASPDRPSVLVHRGKRRRNRRLEFRH